MPVRIHMPLDFVEKIEFIFKQEKDRSAPILKSAVYPDTAERYGDKDLVLIPWSKEDTYLFEEDAPFYMDTRITRNDTEDQPDTPIVTLKMSPSLFEEGDVV